MKRKDDILIFPLDTGIGQEIFHSLNKNKLFNLHGATSVSDLTYAHFLLSKVYILPYVTDPMFVSQLNKLINQLNIDYIFPAHDDVCLKLSEVEKEIKAKVIGHSYEINSIVRFKDKTYEYLKDEYFTPRVLTNFNDIEYPIYAKPKRGEGSRGHKIINSPTEFAFTNTTDFVYMELLTGEEYTIDCLGDKDQLLYASGRSRDKTMSGISTISKIVKDEEFITIAKILQYKFEFTGAWFFQLKRNHEGLLKLLEIGPRVSGTMCTHRQNGVNFSELSYYIAKGESVIVINNDLLIHVGKALVPRYMSMFKYDNVFFDLDDTLIMDDGTVNTDMIKFAYQCLNKGKNIYIITRHGNCIESVDATLREYRLDGLFKDNVMYIRRGWSKGIVISGHPNSILIDDSFAERLDCYKQGIKVFAPSEIKFLLKD